MTIPLDITPYFTGAELSYGATGLPNGLAIDPATGVITGTPVALGTSSVSVTATNSAGSASQSFLWTVEEGSAASTTAEPGAAGHWLFGAEYPNYEDLVSGQQLTELIPGAVTLNANTLTISDGTDAATAQRGLNSPLAQQVEQTVCIVVSGAPGNRIVGGNLTTNAGAGTFMFGSALQNNARGNPHANIVIESSVPQTEPFLFVAHSVSPTEDWVLFRGDASASVIQSGPPASPPQPTTDPIGIGNTAYASGSFVTGGDYAEFIVFNGHRTAAEIEAIYQRSRTRMATIGVQML